MFKNKGEQAVLIGVLAAIALGCLFGWLWAPLAALGVVLGITVGWLSYKYIL